MQAPRRRIRYIEIPKLALNHGFEKKMAWAIMCGDNQTQTESMLYMQFFGVDFISPWPVTSFDFRADSTGIQDILAVDLMETKGARRKATLNANF